MQDKSDETAHMPSADALKRENSEGYSTGIALSFVSHFLKNVPLDKDPQTFSSLMAFFEKRGAETEYGARAGKETYFKRAPRPEFPQRYAQYRKKMPSHIENIVSPMDRIVSRLKAEHSVKNKELRELKEQIDEESKEYIEKKEIVDDLRRRKLLATMALNYVSKPAKDWFKTELIKGSRKRVKKDMPVIPEEPEVPEGFEFIHKPDKPFFYASKSKKRKAPEEQDVKILSKALDQAVKRLRKGQASHIHQNLCRLSDMFGWGDEHSKILSFLWVYENVKDFTELIDEMNKGGNADNRLKVFNILISHFTGVDYDTVRAAFRESSPIIEGGVVRTEVREGDEKKFEWPILNERFLRMLDEPKIGLSRLQQKYVGEQKKPDKPPPPMEKVAKHIDDERYLSALIRGMISGEGRRHVLMYAPPGFGKTYYVDALGYNYDIPVIKLGEDRNRRDGEKSSLSPKERMEDILIGRMLFKNSDALLEIDDADGILDYAEKITQHTEHTISKVLVLRLLEEGGMLWIVNDQYNIPNAIRSRFVAAYDFPKLDREQRISMLFEQAANFGFKPDKDPLLAQSLSRIAEAFDLSIRDMENLARAAKMVHTADPEFGVSEAFEKAAAHNIPFVYQHIGNALSGERKADEFKLELMSAAITSGAYDRKAKSNDPYELLGKLKLTVEQAPHIAAAEVDPVRILVYGPSDTGKEALWRHISDSSDNQIDIIEGDFIAMVSAPALAIGEAMARTKGKNNIYYWKGAAILEHPVLPQSEELKELIRSNMKLVCSQLPGTHVFSAHSTEHHDPSNLQKLPWFTNLFHMRVQHKFMDEKEFERAWGAYLEGTPKKFDKFPRSISAGSFLRFVDQYKALSLIPDFDDVLRQQNQEEILISPPSGKGYDEEQLKKLMESVGPRRNGPKNDMH